MRVSTATESNSYAIGLYGQMDGESLLATDVSLEKKVTGPVGRSLAAAILIGASSIAPTLTEIKDVPSLDATFAGAYQFKDQSEAGIYIPLGYEVRNEGRVREFIKRYPYLMAFFESSLISINALIGATEFAVDYEGLAEEGWENLFLVVYLDDYDDDHVSRLEDLIHDEWFSSVPDFIKQKVTISFDWK